MLMKINQDGSTVLKDQQGGKRGSKRAQKKRVKSSGDGQEENV